MSEADQATGHRDAEDGRPAVETPDEHAAADHAANREANERAYKSGYLSEVQVYEPHRVGLPPLVPYFKELWHRKEFAAELSRAEMRSANTRTFFGQIWLIINPLLLAGVYFVLLFILARRADGAAFFAHLTAGIFAFYYISGAVTTGARSVVGGGALIANMSFPRLLMPMSSVRTAFFRFLPPLAVYFIIHAATGQPWSWKMILAAYFLACMTVFAAGMAAMFATFQVYFRDTLSFLPYFLRIWLYLSPVLWFIEEVPGKLAPFMTFNPLFSVLGGFTDLLVRSDVPPPHIWVLAAVWSVLMAVGGFLFFISREREFAVRL
ncbi:ABC transporter permease [Knoellia locipacati]|uniref:ABC transporter permease n=1 Tax=Knoellia locipacati TaxID=882824 RepID=UPI00384D384C